MFVRAVLVNNAGLLLAKPFINYTSGDFEALVSTILAGFFYISQNAAKQMLRQQSGHVVNISTSVVDQPIADVPCTLQVLTKGGLRAVTCALEIAWCDCATTLAEALEAEHAGADAIVAQGYEAGGHSRLVLIKRLRSAMLITAYGFVCLLILLRDSPLGY
jgi:hypothetical protein